MQGHHTCKRTVVGQQVAVLGDRRTGQRQTGREVDRGRSDADDDGEARCPVVRPARAQLHVHVEAVAPVRHSVGVGGRRRRAPGQHSADPTNDGRVAIAAKRTQVDGQRGHLAQAVGRDLVIVVGLDLNGAEVGVRTRIAEIGPVGNELGAAGRARPTRGPVGSLDPEGLHKLVGVVVQAHALELLERGVAAGFVDLP